MKTPICGSFCFVHLFDCAPIFNICVPDCYPRFGPNTCLWFPTEFLRLIAIVVKAIFVVALQLIARETFSAISECVFAGITDLYPNSGHQFAQVGYNCKIDTNVIGRRFSCHSKEDKTSTRVGSLVVNARPCRQRRRQARKRAASHCRLAFFSGFCCLGRRLGVQ